jgi:hypothetical protein
VSNPLSTELISVDSPVPQVHVLERPEQVAVRLLETSSVETEKIEHVVIEETRVGVHVLAVGPQGPPGVAGSGSGTTVETYVAGATVNGHRVVVTNASGQAIHADNTDPTHANAATKITLGAALFGEPVQVQLIGRITEPSWSWAPNGTIYVGAEGVLTQAVPASPAVFSKPVAVAETATRILIVQEPPTMLN